MLQCRPPRAVLSPARCPREGDNSDESLTVDRRCWRELARNFEREVTDTPRNDVDGEIRGAIRTAAGRRRDRVLVDLGCGPATLIRRHAGLFERAIGVDFAEPVLESARHSSRARPGVEFLCADVEAAGRLLPRTADVLSCMNVITSASPRKRAAIGRSLAAVAREGATLLLVVPSRESVEYVHAMARARRRRTPTPSPDGLVMTDGCVQKYWTAEEIRAALLRWGFEPERLREVPVPWSDEGLDPAEFPGLRGPWDWLAVARRRRTG